MDYAMIVNKDNPLNKDYIPSNLVEYLEYNGLKIDPNHKTLVEKKTLEAFLLLQENAKREGYNIIIDSCYRSYEYQQLILQKNLIEKGEEAYLKVAIPGCSEHQTGLAIDVALNINGKYVDNFDDTFPEIKWLFENAYKFGFILRYPKGKEFITGYNYECWHFRYVGLELALEMHNNNIATLEEYYHNNKNKCKILKNIRKFS